MGSLDGMSCVHYAKLDGQKGGQKVTWEQEKATSWRNCLIGTKWSRCAPNAAAIDFFSPKNDVETADMLRKVDATDAKLSIQATIALTHSFRADIVTHEHLSSGRVHVIFVVSPGGKSKLRGVKRPENIKMLHEVRMAYNPV